MNVERTFIMVKPDGVQRGLVGKILQRFEERGMKIVALKMLDVTTAMAERLYAEHVGKDFYPRLMSYIQSGPVVAGVIEAIDAVAQVRKMVGDTDPAKAPVGTIRQTFAQHISFNVIHASSNLEAAEREISIFFQPQEILSYQLDVNRWLVKPE